MSAVMEVETPDVRFHLVGIPRDHDFVRAETERVILFADRGGEHDDMSAERPGKFHAHVAEFLG